MLDYIKLCLRLDGEDFDEEINQLIASAKEDLISSGISSSSLETKELCKQAITYYVKANFGYDNNDRDAFIFAYNELKTKCALCYSIEEENA